MAWSVSVIFPVYAFLFINLVYDLHTACGQSLIVPLYLFFFTAIFQYSTNDPFTASTTASYSYATSPLTPTQSLSNILMAPGPSSSRYFSLATASPKLVQTTDNDLINKLSSDESSSDSSSSESPAPTPPPNQPRISSSTTASSGAAALFELEPPSASASILAPPTSMSTDASFQRHLLLSTSCMSSDLTSPVLKRDRDHHRVADMGGFMTSSPLRRRSCRDME